MLTAEHPGGAGEGVVAGVGGGQVGVGGQLGPRMFCLFFFWFRLHFMPFFPFRHFDSFFNFPDLAFFFLLVLFFAFLFVFAFCILFLLLFTLASLSILICTLLLMESSGEAATTARERTARMNTNFMMLMEVQQL